MRQTKFEYLQSLKLANDPFLDAKLRAEKWHDNGEHFISEVKIYHPGISILPHQAMVILKAQNMMVARNERPPIILYVDATGGIVRGVEGRSYLHHIIILPLFASKIDRSFTLVNIGELITVNSTAHNLSDFFRLFARQYAELFDNKKFAQMIVSDKSFANIKGLLDGLNRQTINEYLDLCYNAMASPLKFKEILEKIYTIHLCASHSAKNWSLDVNKNYSKVNIQLDFGSKKFICGVIGLLYEINSLDEADRFVKGLFELLCSKFKTNKLM